MTLRTLLFPTFVAASIWAAAITVTTTPGNLKADLGDAADITALTVNGSIDASDFETITDITTLTTLDLSGATIAAYEGDALLSGVVSSTANTLPPFALAGSDVTTLSLPSSLKEISEGALSGTHFAQITIPAGVTTIGAGAFASNEQLQSVTLPVALTTLGSHAFQNCKALTTANLENSALEQLNDNTFESCTSLTSVTLPASIKTIGAMTFNGCSSLATLSFPSALETIGQKAFATSGLTSANLSNLNNLTAIDAWAFANCPNLISVSFPASLTTLGEGAFYSDTKLNLTELPENVKVLQPFAFLGASTDSGIVMANSKVESLEAYSLADWKAASVFKLPGSLTHLGDEAMANWSQLDTIDAFNLREVPSLGENVWGNLNKEQVTLYVYSDLENAFKAADQWQEFDIQGTTTDNGAPTIDFDNNAKSVMVKFEGKLLHAQAPIDIVGARIFDPQGRLYTLPSSISGNLMTIDTHAYNANILVVQFILADNSVATLKLFR